MKDDVHPISSTLSIGRSQVNYFVENNGQERDDLQPLGFGEGGELEEGGSKKRPQNVLVVGAGPAGLAAASTLKVMPFLFVYVFFVCGWS